MILDRIIAHKRVEVDKAKGVVPLSVLRSRIAGLPPPLDFFAALRSEGAIKIIAEIKKASPSKGVLREEFDPVDMALQYAEAGASALSILTDEKFFQGSLDYLRGVRGAVRIPLLRKDFIIDSYQVYESRAAGADALLLIASRLDESALRELLLLAHSLSMEALVEVHNENELGKALAVDSRVIGINNRDLATFGVDLGVSVRLARLIPEDRVVVSESGISAGNIKRMVENGLYVFLIGESLMKAQNPGDELRLLLGR